MEAPVPFNRKLFLIPGKEHFHKRAVLNPSLIQHQNTLHFYYRAVNPDMISTIGYLRALQNGNGSLVIEKQSDCPLIFPQADFEIMGIEDPRVVEFEGRFYMFCTVYNGRDACLGLTSSDNYTDFGQRTLIGPLMTRRYASSIVKGNPKLKPQYDWWMAEDQDGIIWEKDATILPRRINGKIVFIHRLQPNIQIAYIDSLDQLADQGFWEEYVPHMDQFILMDRDAWWEKSHMGMGPVPIETPEGWLMIYHGASKKPNKSYRAGAVLLDLNDPQRIIGRTPEPLFEPVEEWEKVGDVDNVVFPEGLAIRDNVLDIYYGGADSVIGRISVRFDQLIDYLKTGVGV
ncbi:MAG: hypothetical protein V2A56_00035 [bacterium]